MPSRTHNFNTVEYKVYERAASKLNLSPRCLAEAIGYTKGASTGWKSTGKIPKVVQLACECLERRQGKRTDIVISADNVEIIKGDGTCEEIHPGIFVLKL